MNTAIFFVLMSIWLCFMVDNGHTTGVPISNLSVDCPQHIYKIPQYSYKVHKMYPWSVYGDPKTKQVITEALYFVRRIGNKDLVVGVCYRFGGSHCNKPRDNIPDGIRKAIKAGCVIGQCHAGHLVPENMGGTNEPKNFIPQYGSLNSGMWSQFEKDIRNCDPTTTLVVIALDYSNKPMVAAPKDMDIPLLHYQQPDVLKITWYSDNNLFPDPLIYYCASVPNSSNGKDGELIGTPLSILTNPQSSWYAKYRKCF